MLMTEKQSPHHLSQLKKRSNLCGAPCSQCFGFTLTVRLCSPGLWQPRKSPAWKSHSQQCQSPINRPLHVCHLSLNRNVILFCRSGCRRAACCQTPVRGEWALFMPMVSFCRAMEQMNAGGNEPDFQQVAPRERLFQGILQMMMMVKCLICLWNEVFLNAACRRCSYLPEEAEPWVCPRETQQGRGKQH